MYTIEKILYKNNNSSFCFIQMQISLLNIIFIQLNVYYKP